MNIVLDDGSETIRAVMFGEVINSIGISDLESLDHFTIKQKELLGKEMFFSGIVRLNAYFNRLEFSVNKVEEVNISELINELEK